jgi:vacuolar-type H+-ATPase subunit E/Vma4
MALESILDHILAEARAEKEKIIAQAKQEYQVMIRQAQQEAESLYQGGLAQENTRLESERNKMLVRARLEGRKGILQVKQEAIDYVFAKLKTHITTGKLKKQQVFQDRISESSEDIDFYLNRIRSDCESEIAKILCG